MTFGRQEDGFLSALEMGELSFQARVEGDSLSEIVTKLNKRRSPAAEPLTIEDVAVLIDDYVDLHPIVSPRVATAIHIRRLETAIKCLMPFLDSFVDTPDVKVHTTIANLSKVICEAQLQQAEIAAKSAPMIEGEAVELDPAIRSLLAALPPA
jgi:hypothetical protein